MSIADVLAAVVPTRVDEVVLAATRVLEASHGASVSVASFEDIAAKLARSLDHFQTPERQMPEVLSALTAHKHEVTAGRTRGGSGN